MTSVLSRVLPPPVFLTMPSVGVDISDNSLKYISFKPTVSPTAEREIEQWGEIVIPSGTLSRGQIENPKQLTAVLKEFKAQTKAEFIRVSLPEERAYLFETQIKRNIPYKEVRSLLEFRLEENVPIPSKDVLFDYMILPDDGGRNIIVSVAAYARETIMNYYDVCVEAGLRPLSFEVEAGAMARAVVPKDIKGASMLVDFGKTRTGIGIVYKGSLMYTSTTDLGGVHMSQALRKVVGDETGEAELTRLKNEKGLIREVGSSDIRDALIGTVSVIKDEIAARMQYWHLRNDNAEDRRITTIFLCGGSSNLRGLPEYFSETLGVTVVRGNVWENAISLEHQVPPIDYRHSFGYATAIGLALRNDI